MRFGSAKAVREGRKQSTGSVCRAKSNPKKPEKSRQGIVAGQIKAMFRAILNLAGPSRVTLPGRAQAISDVRWEYSCFRLGKGEASRTIEAVAVPNTAGRQMAMTSSPLCSIAQAAERVSGDASLDIDDMSA
jgi:hypothetical protein